MTFLMANSFFYYIFKNKNVCASIVFKAESEPKEEETYFLGGFSSKTKNMFLKLKSQICFSAFVLLLSAVFCPIKKIKITPP